MSKLQIKKINTPFPKVKVRGRQQSHTLNLLFFDWPVTRIVLNKLSAFLTIVLPPDQAQQASQVIVENALEAYSESVYHVNIHKNPDPDRILFFITAVINKTCEVLAEAEVVIHNIENLQLSLYELLTSEQLKIVLKESIDGEAILGGAMHLDGTASGGTGSNT